jgi:hypothetical protein
MRPVNATAREGGKMTGWLAKTGGAARNGWKWRRTGANRVHDADRQAPCGFPQLQIDHSSAI